jgi:hypothetical protein
MKIIKILWPGNSPNLNAIEKAWFWMKKETTKRGPTSNRKKLRVRWRNAGKTFPRARFKSGLQ